MMTFIAWARTKFFEGCLCQSTYTISWQVATMESMGGILPLTSQVGKFCRQVLCGPVYIKMCTIGARHVMSVRRQVTDRRLTYEPKTPILSNGPFEKWGIDAIGPVPRANSRKRFIIIRVDYMTRWTEAITTSSVTAKEVARFVYENICCHFGVPLEILSDRGLGFRGDLVRELMKKLGIARRHSTPYYPQCNGLVEKVNGMIVKMITKQVHNKPRDWDRHLQAALWAYQTSFRTSLGYTAYHSVSRKEALLPIEVQLSSLIVLSTAERVVRRSN